MEKELLSQEAEGSPPGLFYHFGKSFYLSGLLCPKGLNLKVLSNGSVIVLQVRGYNISPIASLEGGGLETTGSLSIRVRYRGKF